MYMYMYMCNVNLPSGSCDTLLHFSLAIAAVFLCIRNLGVAGSVVHFHSYISPPAMHNNSHEL